MLHVPLGFFFFFIFSGKSSLLFCGSGGQKNPGLQDTRQVLSQGAIAPGPAPGKPFLPVEVQVSKMETSGCFLHIRAGMILLCREHFAISEDT